MKHPLLLRWLRLPGTLLAICLCLLGQPGLAQQTTSESIVFGMGCFWGAEKRMGELPGVLDVESGYANGQVAASYEAILAHEKRLRQGQSTARNHAEVVRVRFNPAKLSLESVLARFWESHDPTQLNRQGNDVGSNYRSAIYTQSPAQEAAAKSSLAQYQAALTAAGKGKIATEIAPLQSYTAAEEYHQDYLKKNPKGYCGLGGTGVAFPTDKGSPKASPSSASISNGTGTSAALDPSTLNAERQLIVFETPDCGYCKQFKADVLDHWKSPLAVARSLSPSPPKGWTLEKPLFASPTMVLFERGKEVSRFTGYGGKASDFWKWLGFQLLSPAQQKIAFEQGTEPPGTGSHLDEKRPGTFVDPITGAALFRSDAKFESGTGWPSFFTPLPGAITLHPDHSHGMKRTEVRSASSGIHLGHVFNDGPPPSGKRYCINGQVLRFVPDR
jgi:peptide methionine sulfoxide reductase msrA/msrB